MIRIENLCKRFNRMQALNDISAEFRKGQVISLIGPNGSGKTTLIKSILGMVNPDSGDILFDGKSIKNDDQYRARIGYMPQIGRYPENMKVKQVIDMIRNIRKAGGEPDYDLYHAFGIESIGDKTMRSLSGGTRQKVSATLAFLFDPDVLILDEPTAGLDPVSSEILRDKIIRENMRGKLVLITSHILSDLDELTTHIMYLQEGRVQFSDSLENIKDYTGEARLSKAISLLIREGFKRDTLRGRVNEKTNTRS